MKAACFVCLSLAFLCGIALAQTNPVPFLNQPLVPKSAARSDSYCTRRVEFRTYGERYGIYLRISGQLEWNGPEHNLRQQFATHRDDSRF